MSGRLQWNDWLLKDLQFLLYEEVLGCAYWNPGWERAKLEFDLELTVSSHAEQLKWSVLS